MGQLISQLEDKMKINPRNRLLVLAICFAVALLAITVYSAQTTSILLSGTIHDSQVFNGPVNVTVRMLTLKPGDKLPWHYHPGYALNIVKSGTLTVDDGCGSERTLIPGQGLEEIEGRVHRGRNNTDTDVVVYDSFVIPKDKQTTITFPDDQPRCGPPQQTDECKNNGWRKFNHPQSFASEEQCLTFVRQLRERRFQIN